MRVYSDNTRFKVDFNIPKGLTALVGYSGSGKTFLGKWLSELYKVGALKFSESNIKYVYVNNPDLINWGIAHKGYIIYIDDFEQWESEKQQYVEDNVLPTLLNDNYVIVCSRGKPHLEYTAKLCATLRFENKTFYFDEVM